MLGIGERTLYRKIQEWKKESEKKGEDSRATGLPRRGANQRY